jgi:hypothetical protein
MGLFGFLGEVVAAPIRIVEAPVKLARVAENALAGDDLRSKRGFFGSVEEIQDETVGAVRKGIVETGKAMDD